MPQIENPILNSPYEEPGWHWLTEGVTLRPQRVEGRRLSTYLAPVPPPTRKQGKGDPGQGLFDLIENDVPKRHQHNKVINDIRDLVSVWRQSSYPNVTFTTRRLLEHWADLERIHPLFFCQREAVETAIFIIEAAPKHHPWIADLLEGANKGSSPVQSLPRMAFKMATGSGKTAVMAMLIAWQVLNKLANPQDNRFSDAFLIVAPGLTIRDRLRVLLPSDPESYYQGKMDIVPSGMRADMRRAAIEIINFHRFLPRSTADLASNTKKLLAGSEDPFTETDAQRVTRVCKAFGGKKNVIVINDEAHHCYEPNPSGTREKLSRDERSESDRENKRANLWISGLKAIHRKLKIRQVFDLSATPFFLKGSGYSEGTLFPWVVSDFSLIDAIECGIVKIPRVPTEDNTGQVDPKFRHIYPDIREELPSAKDKIDLATDPQPLPGILGTALQTLYENYEKTWQAYEDHPESYPTPPVFIIVCNNTAVSKWVFDSIAGYAKTYGEGLDMINVPGILPLFSNVDSGIMLPRPRTILIDSFALDSDDPLPADFKRAASTEIERFKDEYRHRFPDRDIASLEDKDLLREVMNTVGKPGTLGEHVRCVVSVSMLTEGWDCNTVTHVLGVRAFGTQLLCEQVIGRALRRRSYALNDEGRLEPEYAEIYGVPFEITPVAGSLVSPLPPKPVTRVMALENRIASEIRFPRVTGYRYELPATALRANFSTDSHYALSTRDIPTVTRVETIVGQDEIHSPESLREVRDQQIAFYLAKWVLERYFTPTGDARTELFPQVLTICREWLRECLTCGDDTWPGLLLIPANAEAAAGRIRRAILEGTLADHPRVIPRLAGDHPEGTTLWVDFETYRPCMETDPSKCHLTHVVQDGIVWEAKVAESLEEMEEVQRYVKNDKQVGFFIPYQVNGRTRNYIPDFIAHLSDIHPSGQPLKLILEVSGYRDEHKAVKAATARTDWLQAINGDGRFGRWAFLECTDPWQVKQQIRALLAGTYQEVSA